MAYLFPLVFFAPLLISFSKKLKIQTTFSGHKYMCFRYQYVFVTGGSIGLLRTKIPFLIVRFNIEILGEPVLSRLADAAIVPHLLFSSQTRPYKINLAFCWYESFGEAARLWRDGTGAGAVLGTRGGKGSEAGGRASRHRVVVPAKRKLNRARGRPRLLACPPLRKTIKNDVFLPTLPSHPFPSHPIPPPLSRAHVTPHPPPPDTENNKQ